MGGIAYIVNITPRVSLAQKRKKTYGITKSPSGSWITEVSFT